jgi:hypothetical protein
MKSVMRKKRRGPGFGLRVRVSFFYRKEKDDPSDLPVAGEKSVVWEVMSSVAEILQICIIIRQLIELLT